MTPLDALRQARAAGLHLSVDGDNLRVRGQLTDDLRAEIQAHKPALLQLLAEEEAERQAIRLAWTHPCVEDPWSPELAAALVAETVETAAAHHAPGGYDAAAFHGFDQACALAFEARDLGQVRATCRAYLQRLGVLS